MPAPIRAAMPKTHGRQPSPMKAASMILSLDQKPENGGTPRIASQPRREGHPRDLHGARQPAEAAHVDLVVHAVHDRAGAEEHAGLEEAVRQQVEDREGVADRAEPGREHHVADLAHRRGREGLLDVVLGATDDRPEEERDRADDGDDELRGRGRLEDRCRAHDEVDAGGDHRRRVDERRDGCRAGHGVAEPALQRELRRLAAGAEQEHEADGRHEALVGVAARLSEHGREVHRAEVEEHQDDRDGQAEVADAVGHERLVGRRRVGRVPVPEADEQVGREADALPADVEQQVAVGQHEQQHRRDEEVEVGEEAPLVGVGVDVAVLALVVHVARASRRGSASRRR